VAAAGSSRIGSPHRIRVFCTYSSTLSRFQPKSLSPIRGSLRLDRASKTVPLQASFAATSAAFDKKQWAAMRALMGHKHVDKVSLKKVDESVGVSWNSSDRGPSDFR